MGCGSSTELKDSNNATFNISEAMLSDYIQIEKEIAEAVSKNPLQPLESKAEQLVLLSEKNKELQSRLKNLKNKTSSSEKDSSDMETRKFLMENGAKKGLDLEQEKYLDLLNEKEIVERELKASKDQYRQLSKEISSLEKQADRLENLYHKQDHLLGNIFGEQYGSLRENQVEMELDHLEAQRSTILEANFKWRQAQIMLEYACKQLSVAVKKWQDLASIPTKELETRYSVAAEARNNIVAAGQNICGAQRYLDNVNFPYCNPNEVATLNKAANYVFTDMQSEERHLHAMNCYKTTYKRANALLQWFDTIINSTIMTDLREVNERVKIKSLELRKERVRLIKLKVKEHFGTDVKLDHTLRGLDVSTTALARANLSDNQVVKVENFGVISQGILTPPLLSSAELAPVPSNSVIFGKTYDGYKSEIKRIAEEHQEELQMFLKEQENNHKKIKGNLEQKLMMRRQRRARLHLEERQKKSLSTPEY